MKVLASQLTGDVSRNALRLALLALCFSIALAPDASAQGFSRHKLNLFPKKPPIVFPAGTRFTVQVYQQGLFDQQQVEKIKDAVEADLPRYDWRLKASPSAPDTVLSFVVTELTAFATRDTYYTSEDGVVGTHKESDPSTGTTVTVPEYGTVSVARPLTILEGHLTVRYEARDAATARRLDGDTITIDFRQGFTNRPPTTGDIYNLMVTNLSHMVAARFVPDFHGVSAPLIDGRFKRVSFLLHHGMWNSALAEIAAVAELPNPEDEAYRLYAYGLTHEGLAYEAPYLVPTINYLKQAAAYYKLAQARKNSEAAFQDAEARVLDLLQAYKSVEDSVRAFEEGKRRKDAEAAILNRFQSQYKSNDFLDNTDVLGWAQSGVRDKEMVDRLRGEKSAYFDLTPESLTALQTAGVSPRVLDAMRESMRGRPYHELSRRKWLGRNQSLLSVYPHLMIRKSSD